MINNTVRKILAIVCGILLMVGVGFSIYLKDDDMISVTVIFAIVYVIYLIVLFKKLKKDEAENKKKSPLRKK